MAFSERTRRCSDPMVERLNSSIQLTISLIDIDYLLAIIFKFTKISFFNNYYELILKFKKNKKLTDSSELLFIILGSL